METTRETSHRPAVTSPSDERAVRALYTDVLTHWNQRNAKGLARLFASDGHVVGFDGSQLDGRRDIESEMARIFTDHQTGRYVGIVREVRFLSQTVALIRAVAGMVTAGQTDLNPAVNTIQTLIAVQENTSWLIAVYQNTPAAWHGRPEAVKALTDELRQHLEQERQG
jgi:uncharacterized protein (TIGR02246 family)